MLSKEALAEAGDLGIRKRRKRRRKVQRTDAATGAIAADEIEEEDEPEQAERPRLSLVRRECLLRKQSPRDLKGSCSRLLAAALAAMEER